MSNLCLFKCLAPHRPYSSFIRIHLVNLRDGSPYYPPPSNVITCNFPPWVYSATVEETVITGSRVMILGSYSRLNMPDDGMAFVWNWKTGDCVRSQVE